MTFHILLLLSGALVTAPADKTWILSQSSLFLPTPENGYGCYGDHFFYDFPAAECCAKKEVGGEVYLLAPETTDGINMTACIDGCAYR